MPLHRVWEYRDIGRLFITVGGESVIIWPVRGFPATQRETRGSPALCVSGSFQGNQRVFGAPFCFSRVSLGKLASFPESESWSGAKSGAKLRKSARYPGIFQVYRGFPGIPAKYPVFCRFCRFCHQEGTPTRFDFREATGIPYHFLISSGLGFD